MDAPPAGSHGSGSLPTPRRPNLRAQRLSRLAVASVVLSVLFPFGASVVAANANATWVGVMFLIWGAMPVAGLICGIVALVKIHHSDGALHGRGLATAGTIMGSIGTFFAVLLIAGGV